MRLRDAKRLARKRHGRFFDTWELIRRGTLTIPTQQSYVFPEGPDPIIGSISATPQQNGLDLQNALLAATPGTVIQLTAGATFLGPFVFPKIAGTSSTAPIIVQSTSVGQPGFPASGSRIAPSNHSLLPVLLYPNQAGSPPYSTPYNGCGCLNFADGASWWVLIGLEVACQFNNPWTYFQLVLVGNNSFDPLSAPTVGQAGPNIQFSSGQRTLSQCPTNITLDRLYIHGPLNDALVPGTDASGNSLSQLKGGIEFHVTTGTITGCWISDIAGSGFETHGIFCANGPGGYQILNNHIEASAENMFCGGAVPAVGSALPNSAVSNCTFRFNHVFKPLYWSKWESNYDGKNWLVKNLFELKSGDTWTVDTNVLENCWEQGDQIGWAFLCTPRGNNDQGLLNTPVRNVTITNNLILNTCGVADLATSDDRGGSGALENITFKGNLAENLRGVTRGGNGSIFYLLVEPQSGKGFVDIEHNTCIAAPDGDIRGCMYSFNGGTVGTTIMPNVTFKDNLCAHGQYGQVVFFEPSGQNNTPAGMNDPNFIKSFPGCSVTCNVYYKIGSGDVDVPLGTISGGVFTASATNSTAASLAAVGCTNTTSPILAGVDYRLTPSSPYKGKGCTPYNGAQDPGANVIDTAIASGTSPPVGTPTTTTITSAPAITVGQTATVTVTVVRQSGTGTPTGSVSLSGVPGTATVSGGTLSGGTATLTIMGLQVGTYTLVANYSGDSTFASSSSASVNLTVNQVTIATNMALTAPGIQAGQSAIITVKVTS